MVCVDPRPPSEADKRWEGRRERDDTERDKAELCWQLAELAVQSDSRDACRAMSGFRIAALNQVLRSGGSVGR